MFYWRAPYRDIIEKNNNQVEETENRWEWGDFLKKNR